MILIEFLIPLIATILAILPVVLILKNGVNQKNLKFRILTQISIFSAVFLIISIFNVNKALAATESSSIAGTLAQGMGFIAAGLATGCSALGAGIAVSSASSAAIGAISENPDNFAKAMIFVALGEGVAIYGILISILILNKL